MDLPKNLAGPVLAALLLTGLVAPVLAAAPATATANTPISADINARLVTNLWVDMDIRQVVQDIAAQTQTVILCDHSVQGSLSMAIKDMPLPDALERVCAAGGYSFTQVKDYYLIGKADPGTALFQRLSEPQRIKLNHVTPDQVRALVHTSMLTYVTFDKAGGTVIVTAPQPLRSKILDAITQLDQPNPQVAIEAVVFELTEDGSKQLALDWQFKSGNFTAGSDNLMQTITYSAGADLGTYVQATLRAIVESRKGQVLANPRVLVMNNTDAEIFVGQEKYFTLLSGQASNPYYTLQSIKAGVTLKVSPSIGRDGQITLALEPEVSDVVSDEAGVSTIAAMQGGTSASFPVVTRRRAKTVIGIRDGETVMIGGLLRDQHRQVIDKVPGAGDIPGLGAAFRKVGDNVERQEVVLLITVHLVEARRNGTEQLTSRLMQRYVTPLDGIGSPTGTGTPLTAGGGAAQLSASAKGGAKMKTPPPPLISILAVVLLALAGCQQPARPQGFSLDRGAQLLAAGSPRSAIPFLTQTVAGTPDGPEPVALLSLAYALDMQPERAILQAQKVRREPGAAPGWENVAIAVARMTQDRPADAAAALAQVGPGTPAARSARQWLVLAFLLDGKREQAVASLEGLSEEASMSTGSPLWLAIIHAQAGQKDRAGAALRRAAQTVATESGAAALKGDLTSADAQTLYDAGLAAVAQGDYARARLLLGRVRERTLDACDTEVWLAFIAGVTEDWQSCRNLLSAACDNGAPGARGLANEFFSVVCALENRPVSVIQFTLLGQRMMGRNGEPAYIHEQAQPEPVWGADYMK